MRLHLNAEMSAWLAQRIAAINDPYVHKWEARSSWQRQSPTDSVQCSSASSTQSRGWLMNSNRLHFWIGSGKSLPSQRPLLSLLSLGFHVNSSKNRFCMSVA